jgi:AcrR family transcriptional regulator
MVKPVSRKRQKTRAALIEATLAIVEEKGLGAVTLDEVAERASVTKGAIYSNYRSKAELLWDAVDTRRLHIRIGMLPGDARGQARAMAKALMDQMPQFQREAAFYSELQSYIRTDPELRDQQAAQQRAQFDWMAGELGSAFREQLTYPPRVVALAVQALALGFTAQWERTPEEVTEEIIAAAFEALAIGATTPRG